MAILDPDLNKLKTLLVDVDSLPKPEKYDWCSLNGVSLIFVGSNRGQLQQMAQGCTQAVIDLISPSRTLIPWGDKIYKNNCDPAETAIVTGAIDEVKEINAMPIACILYDDNEYFKREHIGNLPGFIIESFDDLDNLVSGTEASKQRFFGEYYATNGGNCEGMLLPFGFMVDGVQVNGYAAGRYFKTDDNRANSHALSRRILDYKQQKKPIHSKIGDTMFASLARKAHSIHKITGVAGVPPHPGKLDRYKNVVSRIAQANGLKDYSTILQCGAEYAELKHLPALARRLVSTDVMMTTKDLSGERILVMDDVMVTGSTITDCVRALMAANAEKVVVAVLGVNQFTPATQIRKAITCHVCGKEMHLRSNGTDGSLFFGCNYPICKNSMMYALGIAKWQAQNAQYFNDIYSDQFQF